MQAPTQGTQQPFGLVPLTQPAPALKAKGKFWQKIRSLFSWRRTKRSSISCNHSSSRVQSALQTSTMAQAYWNGHIEPGPHVGAVPGSSQQMYQLPPIHNNLPIVTSSVHSVPDFRYTRTYSATSPVSEGNGFTNENYNLSCEQSHGHRRTTFRNSTVGISGADNVIRLGDQEIRT